MLLCLPHAEPNAVNMRTAGKGAAGRRREDAGVKHIVTVGGHDDRRVIIWLEDVEGDIAPLRSISEASCSWHNASFPMLRSVVNEKGDEGEKWKTVTKG